MPAVARSSTIPLPGAPCIPSVLSALILSAGLLPQGALAQSATPGATEEIVVIAPRSPVVARLDAAPGATAILSAEAMPASANLTISRALADVPGVVVQDFFGGNDQPRIQMRGSGLQQNPVERGVLMLRNGLPLNRADGSYIVGFANPGEAEAVEVYRGYMANRLGATVLGGALNLISPTGRSAPGVKVTASAGSFDQLGGGVQTGFAGDRVDVLIRGDITRRDGYRDYNESRRAGVGGNVGLRLSETLTVRVFASYADLGFDVSGPLTRELLENDPRAVFTGPTVTSAGAVNPGPNVVRDRPRREATQFQTGARATGAFGAHIVDLAVGYAGTDDMFRFPVSAGIRVTEGDDVTLVARYAFKPDAARPLPLFEATAQYVTGSADRENYLNLSGKRGALFGRSRLEADTLSLNAGFNIPLADRLTLSPSLSWSRATRDNIDRYESPTRPTAAYSPANPAAALPGGAVPTVSTGYARTYEGWSPALGLAWQPSDDQTIFAAVSRSFEPPTHDDLLATVNGTPNSSPGRPNPANPALPAAAFVTPALKAQRATTVETGWRGRSGAVSWDAVAYYSWVRNELLSLRDESGTSLGAANAPRTRHLGVELGLTAQVLPTLTGRIAYTWQDFRFRDDPVRGDNRLAGAPRHWINATLGWRPDDRFTVQGVLRWVPEKTPVDNLGTLYNDPYATVDLRGEYKLNAAMTVFAEVANLFDETYAASTLIIDQARPDQAAFLPGDGRAFGGGVRLKF
ncbi:TonB-dependent receptor family protein [Sphingosinicella microcystinivorans]|uniref:TonB-dependent receptor family protein n=1 Tax=Sphingosinicella microcystinivorans TaxID=335406 RepID=UPI0022F3D425|nr:TonB-dependent receptor [Sphingosinicella microcystinivorans]WBX86296.1 TonB-dependent receptor [Sphingosinicella microcystinivorans]